MKVIFEDNYIIFRDVKIPVCSRDLKEAESLALVIAELNGLKDATRTKTTFELAGIE